MKSMRKWLSQIWIRAGTKKKKGSILIEAVLGTMVFIVVFCTICDLIMISNRNSTMVDTAKELARTISVQGGALNTKPVGFASNYYAISELSQMVEENMKAAGFKDGQYRISIQYTRIYNDETNESEDTGGSQIIMGFDSNGNSYFSPTLKIDYLSNFTLTIEGVYRWIFLGFLTGDDVTKLTVNLPGTSEFKYNYDYWPSEN